MLSFLLVLSNLIFISEIYFLGVRNVSYPKKEKQEKYPTRRKKLTDNKCKRAGGSKQLRANVSDAQKQRNQDKTCKIKHVGGRLSCINATERVITKILA